MSTRRCGVCDGRLHDYQHGPQDEHSLANCVKSIGTRLRAMRHATEYLERNELLTARELNRVMDEVTY